MSYMHQWFRMREISEDAFYSIAADFFTMASVLQQVGAALAGPGGIGAPIVNHNAVVFNGPKNCGHSKTSLGPVFPAQHAGGIGEISEVEVYHWLAGNTVSHRVCDGNCAYQDFVFLRTLQERSPVEFSVYGWHQQFCKTSFKPYDLAVVAFLIIAKHHLRDEILVCPDGAPNHWFDAKHLCQMHLGYGMDFVADEDPIDMAWLEEQSRVLRGLMES